MLEQILHTLGIGSVEASVYNTLVESGPVSAGFLARKMHIPRSSLYGYMETLRLKGLVRQSHTYDKKIWQAEPVETIGSLIQNDIESLIKTQEKFLVALPDIQKKYVAASVAPTVTHFEGVEGMRQMFRDILLCHDIKTVALWSMKDAVHFLGREFMEELNTKRVKSRISLRVIWPKEKMVDVSRFEFLIHDKKFLRDIRIAPANITTSIGYWVYNNKTLFISSKKESFGFIVESAELADMLRKQFEVFWEMSKPIKQ
ncbi:MAG: helix-turn-helix domain-containing protein [Patescibacteria group bacterium]